jgi:hypothetical protein
MYDNIEVPGAHNPETLAIEGDHQKSVLTRLISFSLEAKKYVVIGSQWREYCIQGIHYTPSLFPFVNVWDYPRPRPEGRHGTD